MFLEPAIAVSAASACAVPPAAATLGATLSLLLPLPRAPKLPTLPRRTLRHHPPPTRVTNHHASLPTATTATASLISLSLYPSLRQASHAARPPHSLSLSRSFHLRCLIHSTAAADLLKNRVLHSLSASAAFAPAARQASSHADILSPQLTSLIGTLHPRSVFTPAPIRLRLVMQQRYGYTHRISVQSPFALREAQMTVSPA